ncbi:DUF6153 family protein [Streptomyces sp. NPDC000410]|uniref:DUF6153 family protein n=1 Tax=Streptomyces sp. NPDC000410 TaxID=3154254 RepID=UPI003325BE4F
MSQQVWRAARPHGVRDYVLLVPAVLAVLAGLVAMHGLGPAVPSALSHPAPAGHAAPAAHAVPVAPAVPAGPVGHAAPAAAPAMHEAHHVAPAASHTAMADPEGCVHADRADHDGGGAGGHAEHADATCAAGGTSTAPELPAPHQGRTVTGLMEDLPSPVSAATPSGRAPPSLSELQLLRI